mgnify:CR=1 FL=1
MLSGIELARPDEWYICCGPKGHDKFVAIHAEPCRLRDIPEYDLFLDCRDGGWIVTCGVTGTALSMGRSRAEALELAELSYQVHGREGLQRLTAGWLDTHPLSPRYRWAVGVANRGEKGGDA